jgi:co-chaperonin GroES (HSP10)
MIIPLQNYLVVEQEANEPKQVNGIWLPEQQRPEKQFEGVIVAKGAYVKDPDLQLGTRIALNAYGTVVKRKETKIINGEKHLKEYVIVREIDIIAILQDDGETKSGRIEPSIDGVQDYME